MGDPGREKWKLNSNYTIENGDDYKFLHVESDGSIKLKGEGSTQLWSLEHPYVANRDGIVPVSVEKDGQCWASQSDEDLSNLGMNQCDVSMSLLLGKSMSVGTLQSIVKDIKEHGTHRMPGVCCLDDAANSQYFGYNVSLLEKTVDCSFV